MKTNDSSKKNEISGSPGEVRIELKCTKHLRERKFQTQESKFLRGPVPMKWLASAERAGGKALYVGLVIWHEAAMAGSQTIKLHTSRIAGQDFHLETIRRAVKLLATAGLIKIEHRNGGHSDVTLLKYPQKLISE